MIQIGNAPCSWGVIENTEGERTTYVQVLDEMRAAGYFGTELGDWGFMPTDPSQLKDELARRQMSLIASWVSVRLYDADYHDAGIEAALNTARLVAAVGGPNSIIVLGDDHSTVEARHNKSGRIQPEDGLDPAGWASYAAGAMRVAKAVREETGLRTAYHHHAATYAETPAEIDTFLSLTDPDVIGLCFDTGHYTYGGGDAVAGLHKLKDRVWHVHFKDCSLDVVAQADANNWTYTDMVGQGVFSELGQGVVDFPAIAAQLADMAYDGWIVVEQDVLPGMGKPKDSAARNRNYLQSIAL